MNRAAGIASISSIQRSIAAIMPFAYLICHLDRAFPIHYSPVGAVFVLFSKKYEKQFGRTELTAYLCTPLQNEGRRKRQVAESKKVL